MQTSIPLNKIINGITISGRPRACGAVGNIESIDNVGGLPEVRGQSYQYN